MKITYMELYFMKKLVLNWKKWNKLKIRLVKEFVWKSYENNCMALALEIYLKIENLAEEWLDIIIEMKKLIIHHLWKYCAGLILLTLK